MNNGSSQQSFDPMRIVKKLLLSSFVVVSFAAYALHKPANSTDVKPGAGNQSSNALVSQPFASPTPSAQTAASGDPQQATPTDSAVVSATTNDTPTAPAPAATVTAPAPTNTVSAASGQYKNGTFTGPEVDAFYGLVKVQAVIKNGKIANVTFLEYPSDRRTSQRINAVAVPWLQQEAVQVQNANVDFITGATLTSQAFSMSLQSALDQAKP